MFEICFESILSRKTREGFNLLRREILIKLDHPIFLDPRHRKAETESWNLLMWVASAKINADRQSWALPIPSPGYFKHQIWTQLAILQRQRQRQRQMQQLSYDGDKTPLFSTASYVKSDWPPLIPRQKKWLYGYCILPADCTNVSACDKARQSSGHQDQWVAQPWLQMLLRSLIHVIIVQ